jgi:hypothetical protein
MKDTLIAYNLGISLMNCVTPIPQHVFLLDAGEKRYRCLMNVPLCSSVTACRNSSWVFIAIGPYHATGSPIGLEQRQTCELLRC